MVRSVLVTGATGKQGGAVIKALLDRDSDFIIVALTRNPESASAKKLASLSPKIKIVKGDLNHVEDIFSAAKAVSNTPIEAVFSVQPAMTTYNEEPQGKGLIDVALENMVKHFVYTSVDRGGPASDANPTNVPHFITKHNIEKHLFSKCKDGRMNYTVLRPVAFYDNLVPGFSGKIFATSFERYLQGRPLQLVATSDIGFFAAEALSKPEEYSGRKLSLAGDELTFPQFKGVFEEKTGQKLETTFAVVADAIGLVVSDMGSMFQWFHDVGYNADIAALKKLHPELKSFGTWLETDSEFRNKGKA